MKKLISIILIFMVSLTTTTTIAKADMDNVAITIKQTGNHCTIDSIGMMFRRKAILDKNENWSSITEKSLLEKTGFPPSNDAKYVDTTVGLNMTTTGKVLYRMQKNDYRRNANIDNIISNLKSLLDKYSEGIVLYVYEDKPSDKGEFKHAVLLTRYNNNNFYCIDPANSVPSGEINLMNSLLADEKYANTSSVDVLLSYSVKVWYISSSSNESTISESTPSVHNNAATDTTEMQKCGDNAHYTFNNGILTISGSGNMWDYEWGIFYDENTPIEEFTAKKRAVTSIVIEEGITTIGKLAFFGFHNLKNVEIPYSVKHIGEGAFYGLENIEQFTYNGNMDDWKLVSIDDTPRCNTSGKILTSLKTNSVEANNYVSPYKTGTPYQINVTDENSQILSTAYIDENGLLTKVEGKDYDNTYIYFQPLFNTEISFIDKNFIGTENSFEYNNNKISSVSSIGTLENNDGSHKANSLGQIIGYDTTIYEFNDKGLCTKAEYPTSRDYWGYDQNNHMTTYGYIGMAPTYSYSYDETGKLISCEVSGPGMFKIYDYEYSTQYTENTSTNSKIKILINNKFLVCDQPPVLVNNRTLVPMRAIFEALGSEVDWDGSANTATAIKDGKTISLTIGKNSISINGTKKELDVSPMLINNRTMIPVRAVAEAFNCDVDWNQAKQYVIIIPKNQTPYRVEVLDEQNDIISTAHFDDKGRLYQIDNDSPWLEPFYININGNVFEKPYPFGKTSYIKYDEKNRIEKIITTKTKTNADDTTTDYSVEYNYQYNNEGMCIATGIMRQDKEDENITYKYDTNTCSIYYESDDMFPELHSYNEAGLLEKSYNNASNTYRKYGYNEFNNLVTREALSSGTTYHNFEYNDEQQLTLASYDSHYGNKSVTYRYVQE